MVGVGTQAADLDAYRSNFGSLLGRDAESWGLSYYGRLQHRGTTTQLMGSRFGIGSIIGVHLDMWRGILSFYKNRRPLGKYFL
jgi:SPRY domain-containing SOCS box protein 3